MKKRSVTRVASCLCGGVKVRILGKVRPVLNCHCSQCMKTHGNFSAYTECFEEDLKFLKKSTLIWFQSSSFAKRGFCSNCGGSVFYKKIKSDSISVSAGMFNYPTKLKTSSNIFVKGKLDYYSIDKRLKNFHQFSANKKV